ncbi:DUF3024 domain-containing protein [Vibrio sp. S4M6]|uniref:DUF3024 domain-containing protein n=1 Tax=Vibrio sinus TaxID=2946865 RepID=UPI00202A7463|nr:DUF3024 domain-containing protein [Vibrio sinus]MCL9780013.1 DUF3024 domain-containing protein [Vibrio sinus]
MSLVSILQRQVESRALVVCSKRNKGVPVELGGRSNFETIDNGVEFVKQHYLLDSAHCDYMSAVARVQWNDTRGCWLLSVPREDDAGDHWLPYPHLSQSKDLTEIMREIEKDPYASFW